MKREAVKCGAKVVGKTYFLELSSLLHNIHIWCFTSVKDSVCFAFMQYESV